MKSQRAAMNQEYPLPEKIVRTVKEMDEDQQPREKAEKYGVGVLSVPELWAIILRTGTPGYPITELCRDLMRDNNGSLHKLERRTKQELCEMRGIGNMKAIQILSVIELIKRYFMEDIPIEGPIRSSNQIYDRMRHKIGNIDHEEIWMLILNRQNKVTKEFKLTSGTGTSSVFDLKQAIKLALLENAEGMILCHNHPSGTLKPSPQDDKLTSELKEACKFMNIRFLDHVIVTANGHYSYNDSSRL
ncbi:MAG: DNA repair protein RadC [Muribaculaceae bacterium]|nr:DNA repair protein RadC [Muribaculaceae bacterium]